MDAQESGGVAACDSTAGIVKSMSEQEKAFLLLVAAERRGILDSIGDAVNEHCRETGAVNPLERASWIGYEIGRAETDRLKGDIQRDRATN